MATEIRRQGEMMADISKYLDKTYEQQEFSEPAELPIDALQGVSKADTERLL